MSVKTASLDLQGSGLRFAAQTGSGHALVLDAAEGDAGPRPAELVAVAIGGCTAMDVISILRKKRQPVDRYAVKVRAEQRDGHPAVFVRIDIIHVVEGPAIDVEAVRRAIELSATRYCSVGGTLATGVTEIHHRYIVRAAGADEVMGEVLVTGPHEQTERGAPDADVALTSS